MFIRATFYQRASEIERGCYENSYEIRATWHTWKARDIHEIQGALYIANPSSCNAHSSLHACAHTRATYAVHACVCVNRAR